MPDTALPFESFIVAPPAVALIEETERSLDVASFSATVVVKTIPVDPEPLAYVATSLLDRVMVGEPVTVTASLYVQVIEIASPTP